jgi:branched-chain amino acid transport system ATP-binding protein
MTQTAASSPATAALETRNLTIQFGGLKAVADFNLHVPDGSITGLIGPTGAGKTTVFNMLTGVYRPTSGEILANGKSLVGLKPYEITRRGLARTFQNIRLYKELALQRATCVDESPGLPRPKST